MLNRTQAGPGQPPDVAEQLRKWCLEEQTDNPSPAASPSQSDSDDAALEGQQQEEEDAEVE